MPRGNGAYTKEALAASRPDLNRGDPVVVDEEGLLSWTGTVGAGPKPSPESGWWVDIVRDDDGITWAVHSRRVRRREN